MGGGGDYSGLVFFFVKTRKISKKNTEIQVWYENVAVWMYLKNSCNKSTTIKKFLGNQKVLLQPLTGNSATNIYKNRSYSSEKFSKRHFLHAILHQTWNVLHSNVSIDHMSVCHNVPCLYIPILFSYFFILVRRLHKNYIYIACLFIIYNFSSFLTLASVMNQIT